MDSWTLPLPYRTPPLSLNSRLNPYAKNRITQDVKKAGWAMAKATKVPSLHAAILELVWFKGDNRRADADNLAATLKPLQDGLVLAKILPDDSGDRVLSARLSVILKAQDPYPERGPRMELRITDASALAP